MGLLLCDAKYNSSTEAKVVLLIVVSVIKLSEKVFDLRGADSDVSGYSDIKPASDGHCKGAYRAKCDTVLRPLTAKEGLHERGDSTATQIDAWAEEIGDLVSGCKALSRYGVSADFGHQTNVTVWVKSKLTVAAVAVYVF